MSPAGRLDLYHLLLTLPTAHLTEPGHRWLVNQTIESNKEDGGDPILHVGYLRIAPHKVGHCLRVQTDMANWIAASSASSMRGTVQICTRSDPD